MPPDEDLVACRALLRDGSKTFSAASRLLPRRVRDPATVLYAFCRVADDAIDAVPGADRAVVEGLRRRLDRTYDGRPDDSPVDRALARLVREERVPRVLLDALLDGFTWDAEARRYETLDELVAYAARVAGTVGAMMTLLMGPRAPEAIARACDLGVAMQLTNVARDVGEDASRGRIYLPLAWMREAGLDPDEWLRSPRADAATRAVVARLLEAAEGLYRRAEEGIPLLPSDCRTAIFAARLLYADIGRYVEKAGFDSVTRRAHVPLRRKIWLLLRSLGGRWLRVEPRREPPLGPTEFLVSACAEAP